MENKHLNNRPFLLIATLIVLSFFALIFNGVLIYTGFFFSEAQRGLEIYLSDTFAKFSFPIIYILLSVLSLILLVSVVLMWLRKKLGVLLYFSWSFILVFLLLFAEQIDWLNIFILLIFCLVIALNRSYFSVNFEKSPSSNSVIND
jgi:hypothetical protein